MTRKLSLPDAPKAMPDRRMSAQSAQRNAWPILELLEAHAPQTGRVLELAAGTGEHAVRFARALRGLDWQPTDVDPERLASIEAWRQAEGPVNLASPIELDATAPGWAEEHGPVEMILLVNLLHLISAREAEAARREGHQRGRRALPHQPAHAGPRHRLQGRGLDPGAAGAAFGLGRGAACQQPDADRPRAGLIPIKAPGAVVCSDRSRKG